MNKESVEGLRFDRRLRHRPDWVQDTDLEAYLTSLPDVSEKMTTCADAEEAEKAAEATAEPTTPTTPKIPTTPTIPTIPTTPATQQPSTETAVPTAGDFSTPSPFGGFGDDSGGN